jgi:hypothetical protein
MEYGKKWSWPNRGTSTHLSGGTEENQGRTRDMLGPGRGLNRTPSQPQVVNISLDLRKSQCPTRYLYNGIFEFILG